jgi:hypothetical protein
MAIEAAAMISLADRRAYNHDDSVTGVNELAKAAALSFSAAKRPMKAGKAFSPRRK